MLPRPHPSAPPVWRSFFHKYLEIDFREADHLWHVMSHSKWSRPCEIRSALLCAYATNPTPMTFTRVLWRNMSPRRLIAMLEDLVAEGQLTRQEATRYEERILRHTNRYGYWQRAQPS
jgi:hypothetical protein